MTPFTLFFALAVLLLAVELLVLQFSVFWVAFFGLGALVAAVAVHFFPGLDWGGTTAVFVAASAVICVGLFKPLRRWQNGPGVAAGNDAIGQRVSVLKPVAVGSAGQVHWSGTEWRAELAEGESEEVEQGAEAEIVALSGITLYIKSA
jgi:membrane protein implicated in regulation of membrane protease activity